MKPGLSRFQFALLAPHIAPKIASPPGAAAAILQFQESLIFAGWSAAQARVEVRRLALNHKSRKEMPNERQC